MLITPYDLLAKYLNGNQKKYNTPFHYYLTTIVLVIHVLVPVQNLKV
ncbi:hypothetical protein CEY12_02115 [Chryseobacterium sp. T16E-39]|nr:hypothetical protein CEY12_02115 [Chryseobacterium sp. T16E-39]